jgi:hypothetical protein
VRAEGERFEEAATLLEGMLEIRADVRAYDASAAASCNGRHAAPLLRAPRGGVKRTVL